MNQDTNKDLYKILGITKAASEKDIKKAYRALAFEYHPDKNSSVEAQDKFKELGEAYGILSSAEKRKAYDMYGYESIKNGGNYPDINPLDLFQSLFNVDFTKQMKGNVFMFSDLSSCPFGKIEHKMNYEIECSLDELYHGTKKEFSIKHKTKNGLLKTTKYIINIKRGSAQGDNIIVKEGGNYIPELSITEDLVILVVELKDDIYQRKKDDLYIEKHITLVEALCGCQLQMDHFGDILDIALNGIIGPNKLYQVFNKGMPIKKETDESSLKDSSITDEEEKDYGNLIIDLIIDFPASFSESQIQDLKNTFKYEKNIKGDSLVAYYYKDKEEIVKDFMNESEEDNEMGCIQQ
jgi:DnaJ-class molecular chaperone